MPFIRFRTFPFINTAMLVLFLLLQSKAQACRCRLMSLPEEITNADHIFTGTVLKKVAGNAIGYVFAVSTIFKGEKKDTITIYTGVGGPDCGMIFEIGKTYLVYSKNNQTNRCRRNGLAADHPDMGPLRLRFNQNNIHPARQ